MADTKSILHELYVFSEWKPEPEYLQKPDGILPENISSLWRWLKFFGLKKNLIDSVTAHKEKQLKWHIALGDEGKVLAILTDNILEIRTKRSEYATIAARTTVARDSYPKWRKLVWSPDCSFLVVAYGNGIVSFFDLTASNLFFIPTDCSRPGGLECTDNTHAVCDILFMPLRVKDAKWNWEVVVVTYDGKLRGYLVSASEGFKLHHSFSLGRGVSAAAYCHTHNALYVAGAPSVVAAGKEPRSAAGAGVTAWRVLQDEPFYQLSLVSGEPQAGRSGDSWHHLPMIFNKNLDFVVRMSISPDCNKLVCLHCSGEVSLWRLPVLSPLRHFALSSQPGHALASPRRDFGPDPAIFHPADVAWWSDEEIILSRFSGAVSVCSVQDMINILGKGPEFFEGTPQVSCARDGSLLALECESSSLPTNQQQSTEVVRAQSEPEESLMDLTKELFKSVLYAITDIEAFQPKPKKITVVSRIYRLLAIKSTTPTELFSRKIESGKYSEALSLAESYGLDGDLVYQQQWRRNPVSTDAIHNYLSKVSKKIWVVHQCVDRLPETLPAARHLLAFGLDLTNTHILDEINKDLEEECQNVGDITLEHLNAYTSELLRCRHVMLFYQERLQLYEAIIRCEKSTYVKDEYDRLRSNSIVHSAMEIAKEGRIEALTCLWPYLKNLPMQLAVLDKLPETLYPLDYQHLLPTKEPLTWFEKKSPIKIKPSENDNDWCKKDIFRSIWSSNWSEDTTPESETASLESDLAKWYEKRAREIEERCGLVSHSLTLVTIATVGGAVEGLDTILFHLLTLDTLIYDINVEGVTLQQVEKLSYLDTSKLLMKMSTPPTFVSDLKEYVIPFLKRYEILSKTSGVCLTGMVEFLESISVDDLSYILLVLQSPREFELDVCTHLELVERCLYAHNDTHQLHMACDLLATILKETDGSISRSSLVRRAGELERVVAGSLRLEWRGLRVPPAHLRDLHQDRPRAAALLARLARSLHHREEKPTQQDWENLLKDILELRETLLECITKEQCYEAYASALLTSGDAAGIRLASSVLSVRPGAPPPPLAGAVGPPAPPPVPRALPHARSVQLVADAAKEYFNSASSLTDPALELAKCCLMLIEDGNKEIERELDLIAALPILGAFNLTLLPIQVRLCEDRMKLIEDCLELDPNAFLAGHKLLKLAKFLRIAEDDEQTREGLVLSAVCSRALAAGAAGGGAAGAAARRLAALRHAPAAPLLAAVAAHAHAHADTAQRRALLAAALAHAPPHALTDMLRARLSLELESLRQMGAAARDDRRLDERWPSTEDEFSDAITTPVVEQKDSVPPLEKKVSLLNYLSDACRNRSAASSGGEESPEGSVRSVRCQEFYRHLYPELESSPHHYRHDGFSVREEPGEPGQAALRWLYVQGALDADDATEREGEVVTRCAEELVSGDAALGVSCLVLGARLAGGSRAAPTARRTLPAALYAALLHCSDPDLRDAAYRARPAALACETLKRNDVSEEQMAIIRRCIDKLSGMGEVDRVREYGLAVNDLLFNADPDYRREIVYRLARLGKAQAQLACSLAQKHELDTMEVWLQYAATALGDLDPDSLPPGMEGAGQKIHDTLWPSISGTDHAALINFFTLLKKIDDKLPLHGLTPSEHIKLLKKTRAASKELDYKMLLSPSSVCVFSCGVVRACRPDTVGLVAKLLRSLPPPLRSPLPSHALYTAWLTDYFFSVGESNVSSKKWMQQWRQCASYFTKLSPEELLKFVTNTCFTEEAIRRVPPGTRSLMVSQAADYCTQEQEAELKYAKNSSSWSSAASSLSDWARFLDNYHSDSVAALRAAAPGDWTALEASRGCTEAAGAAIGTLVAGEAGAGADGLRPQALRSLLRCLRLPLAAHHALQHALGRAKDQREVQCIVTRVIQYHKDGIEFPEEFFEEVLEKAAEHGLPPHKQLGLLSLSRRTRVQDGDDMIKIAHSSVDLFKKEWPEMEYVQQLTEDKLLSESGREEVFRVLVEACDSWARKKALVDALACWPRTALEEGLSAQGSMSRRLVREAPDEARLLLPLLLRRPMLTDEEVKSLAGEASDDTVVNTIWVILLSKCESSEELLVEFAQKHKDLFKDDNIEDDLVKELLDQGMFIKLVSSPLYLFIVNYIIRNDANKDDANLYTVTWATSALVKAKYLAEAGHLQLLSMGVPSVLRGFSQSVLYCKNNLK